MRHTDEIQSHAEQCSVRGIYQQLEEQITAEAVAGVLQGLCHHIELTMTAKADQAVAKVLAVDQHEAHKNNGEPGGFHWARERSHHAAELLNEIAWRGG